MKKKIHPLVIVLLLIVAFLVGLKYTQGKILKGGQATPTPTPLKQAEVNPTEGPKYPLTVGNFSVTNQEICLEDGLPIVYYFGSQNCPHCSWETPIFTQVTAKFAKEISLRVNIDNQDDQDVFARYSDINPGYIPFLVFGCKYARLGSGETDGEAAEVESLTVILCKLTGNQPASVCGPLKEKVTQIP